MLEVRDDLQPGQSTECSRCTFEVADNDEELREFLELDLEEVHVAINLVNDEEVNMMSWDVIHKATQEDGTKLKLMDHIRHGMPYSDLELD